MHPERIKKGRVYMRATVVIQPHMIPTTMTPCSFCNGNEVMTQGYPIVISIGRKKQEIGILCTECRDEQIEYVHKTASRMLGQED